MKSLEHDITLPLLYDVDVNNVSPRHIFRVVLDFCLAIVIFWLIGARRDALTVPALWSAVVCMLGLAAGMTISLIVDGVPAPLLLVYLALEIGFGVVGLILIIQRYAALAIEWQDQTQ